LAGGLVTRYLRLGLSLGRHVDGLVDAYYGPPELAQQAGTGSPPEPASLVAEARSLIAELDAGARLDEGEASFDPGRDSASIPRRRWLRAQIQGLLTTARILAGERIAYADEVELCYGVRPKRVEESVFERAHEMLDAVIPGRAPLAERYSSWREAQAVPTGRLEAVIGSLVEDLRERTRRMFPLPDGERVDFELVTGKPWSGFNYYLGGFRSRVAVNVDLPVLGTSLAHLVAHEAYPGHHTEHSRKEAGLVRTRRFWEESIFLVGTPQCLLAEGLADLGLEVVMGRRPEALVAEHMWAHGLPYEPEVVAAASEAGEALGAVRANAAFRLHEDGADPETVVEEVRRWALLPRPRAEKAVAFLMDPTWRTYVTCYVEGLALCRSFVAGRPERFARLVTEQLVPGDLAGAGSWRAGPAGP
jgi:hypothetical protein